MHFYRTIQRRTRYSSQLSNVWPSVRCNPRIAPGVVYGERHQEDSSHLWLCGRKWILLIINWYSTSLGESESRPFHEEPETFISILTSTTPMHLEPFYALGTAGTSTATGQESSTCWSLTISRRRRWCRYDFTMEFSIYLLTTSTIALSVFFIFYLLFKYSMV